ncbi:Glutamate N-acetyltransferase / N-acetylglutamate synthase [Desulfurella amilsii]|uniref:Arginine biosynthesis bifunctional protein ArgJ n=1 Tax=Desulfurella amilsii TaxID=1562698 RepID=A0A1X4XWZ3_9BACT|nr:bifunctional glutamate N-acetyltransferase/amino-acid acetyltransferase ArgJ [Desulfurella amilsii]OSS42056.1 Glutamate N-acetyltransferase / N-acetylglutamate synthase [Desulfurella amilsii]
MNCKITHDGFDVFESIKTASVRSGIKKKGEDLALIYFERQATFAAVFTTNKVKAHCVVYDEALLKNQQIRAVLINSGNANACNTNGYEAIQEMTKAIANHLNIKQSEIFIAQTGIIGEEFPTKKVINALQELKDNLGKNTQNLARAILTTDKVPKIISIECKYADVVFHIGGVAKGAGMIHPNMATMLSFIATDLSLNQDILSKALKESVDKSFNRISVDGDMSTNDTVFIASTNEVGESICEENEFYRYFVGKLTECCVYLAKEIVKDGEGATKFCEVLVFGADNDEDAQKVARSIANSLLVKTAIFGKDPNWGRIIAAVGYSGANIDVDKLEIKIGDSLVYSWGKPQGFDKVALLEYMRSNDSIKIYINLNIGGSNFNLYFSDLTNEYIKINAQYHT